MAPASRREQIRFLKAACLPCSGLMMAGAVCDSKYPRCGSCSSKGTMCEYGDATQTEQLYKKRKAEVAALRTQQRREARAQRDAQSGFASESDNSISASVSRSSMSPHERFVGKGASTGPGNFTGDEVSPQPTTNPSSTNADVAKSTIASAKSPAMTGSDKESLQPTTPGMGTSPVHESATSPAASGANMDNPQPMTPPSSMSPFDLPSPSLPYDDDSNFPPQRSGSTSSTLSDPLEFLEDPFSGVALSNMPMPDDQEHHTSSKRSHHTESESQDGETSPVVKQDRARVKRQKRTGNTSRGSRVPDATR